MQKFMQSLAVFFEKKQRIEAQLMSTFWVQIMSF